MPPSYGRPNDPRQARRYSGRATFVDERAHGKPGGCGAYNLAYATALEGGYDYVIPTYAHDEKVVYNINPRFGGFLAKGEAQR
jgi:hypothetical protein